MMRIAGQVEHDITYSPDEADAAGTHPLSLYGRPQGSWCVDNAHLLRGLFRSIGLDGDVKYIWNGTPEGSSGQLGTSKTYQCSGRWASFQAHVPLEDNALPDPRFRFHAAVLVDGSFYDPSYGLRFQKLNFIEAVQLQPDGITWKLLTGSQLNTYQQYGNAQPSESNTTETCQ